MKEIVQNTSQKFSSCDTLEGKSHHRFSGWFQTGTCQHFQPIEGSRLKVLAGLQRSMIFDGNSISQLFQHHEATEHDEFCQISGVG